MDVHQSVSVMVLHSNVRWSSCFDGDSVLFSKASFSSKSLKISLLQGVVSVNGIYAGQISLNVLSGLRAMLLVSV